MNGNLEDLIEFLNLEKAVALGLNVNLNAEFVFYLN